MQAFFSSDGSYALQFLVIFLVILVLFLIAAMLFMRLSGRGLSLTASQNQRGRQPRLGIVDIYELDRQRQLILLRRDNVEHLLLVGGPNDVVIERHIQRGAGSRYAPEGGGRSEAGSAEAGMPPRTDPFLDSPAPPTFAMPEVVSAAVQGVQPVPDRMPSLDPGLFEPEIAPADARPASPVSRLIRRTAPPVAAPRVETASERATRPDPVPPPPAAPEPPVVAGREPRPVDPAVLSDMARQLQVALKRPSSAVTPPPGRQGEPPPVSQPAEPAVPVPPDPVAAAMAIPPIPPPMPPTPPKAAPAARPEPAPSPVQAEPPVLSRTVVPPRPDPIRFDPPKAEPPQPEFPKPELPKPEPAQPGLAKPELAKIELAKSEAAKSESEKPELAKAEAAKSEPAKSEPAKPEPSQSAPKKPEPAESGGQGQNPFSVEEIEAEFARLLGRPLDSKG